MILKQLLNRVQHEADARLSDVVERLLFILEYPPFLYEPKLLVWKWEQTGLLSDLDEEGKVHLSQSLEKAAIQLIDWTVLESPSEEESDKKVGDTFTELREWELIAMDNRDLTFREKLCENCKSG